MASKNIPVHIAYKQHSPPGLNHLEAHGIRSNQWMMRKQQVVSFVASNIYLLLAISWSDLGWVATSSAIPTSSDRHFVPPRAPSKKTIFLPPHFTTSFGPQFVPILVTLLDQIKRRQNFVVTYNASPSSVESTESSNLVFTLGPTKQQERFHSNISVTHKAVPAATTQRIDQVDTSGTSWHASWMLPALGAGLPLVGKMPWHCLGTVGTARSFAMKAYAWKL